MNIRIAKLNDLDEINLIYIDVIKNLNEKNIYMWDNEYPFCEFQNDINKFEMYVIEKNNKIIGAFSICKYDDPEYNVIDWKNKDKSFVYINRLAISLLEQGRGYAKLGIKYIEDYATKNRFESIRITVNEKNIPAIFLYEKLGYKKVKKGVYILNDGNKLIGYEKIIK